MQLCSHWVRVNFHRPTERPNDQPGTSKCIRTPPNSWQKHWALVKLSWKGITTTLPRTVPPKILVCCGSIARRSEARPADQQHTKREKVKMRVGRGAIRELLSLPLSRSRISLSHARALSLSYDSIISSWHYVLCAYRCVPD